jgi:DNA-binding IclR family transcriptional regulator
MSSEPQVKILDKALRTLMLFTPERPAWGVTEAAREVGMPKSTVHRILRVLQQHAFLSQDAESRRYRLGVAALELGQRAHDGLQLRSIARPIMERVATASGETVLLQVVSSEGDRVVCIERVQHGQGLRMILDVGATRPLYAGCISKVLLAFLDEQMINRVLDGDLEPLTAGTIVDPERIREELAEIRRNGYAVSFEEIDAGVAGVSAAILDHRGDVVGGLSISGPVTRVNEETIARYVALAIDGALQVSTELGYQLSQASA